MTPLGLSGCCHAKDTACLVMSLAWMVVTGEGAGIRENHNEKKLSVARSTDHLAVSEKHKHDSALEQ